MEALRAGERQSLGARAGCAHCNLGRDPARRRKLALGAYQGIFFCELDGPKTRRVYVAELR